MISSKTVSGTCECDNSLICKNDACVLLCKQGT